MLRVVFFRFVCLSACFILTAADETLVVEPSRLLVEYGAKASANCSTTFSHNGMGWEASQEPVDMVENVKVLAWTVPKLTHWDIKPLCYINLKDGSQKVKELPITVYKLPDTLSINIQNCSGPVIEGKTCLLQCDIQNVAPVQYLKAMWYKQQFLMENKSFTETSVKPVSASIYLAIQPSRNDDGAKYWCEAKLELGPEGPQPPPTKKSDSFRIAVHYKPVFSNETEIIEAGDGANTLNCTATANPPSVYSWDAPHLEKKNILGPSLLVSLPGNYTCTASNLYGKAKKLFIITPKYRDHTTFWIILVVGLLLAAVLIIGYIIKNRSKRRGRSANHSMMPSLAVLKGEGEEIVLNG